MGQHAGGRRNLVTANPHANAGITPDVFDPSSGLAMFAEQIELPAPDDKPDLDFARHPGHPSGRGQMEHLFLPEALKVQARHDASERAYLWRPTQPNN